MSQGFVIAPESQRKPSRPLVLNDSSNINHSLVKDHQTASTTQTASPINKPASQSPPLSSLKILAPSAADNTGRSSSFSNPRSSSSSSSSLRSTGSSSSQSSASATSSSNTTNTSAPSPQSAVSSSPAVASHSLPRQRQDESLPSGSFIKRGTQHQSNSTQSSSSSSLLALPEKQPPQEAITHQNLLFLQQNKPTANVSRNSPAYIPVTKPLSSSSSSSSSQTTTKQLSPLLQHQQQLHIQQQQQQQQHYHHNNNQQLSSSSSSSLSSTSSLAPHNQLSANLLEVPASASNNKKLQTHPYSTLVDTTSRRTSSQLLQQQQHSNLSQDYNLPSSSTLTPSQNNPTPAVISKVNSSRSSGSHSISRNPSTSDDEITNRFTNSSFRSMSSVATSFDSVPDLLAEVSSSSSSSQAAPAAAASAHGTNLVASAATSGPLASNNHTTPSSYIHNKQEPSSQQYLTQPLHPAPPPPPPPPLSQQSLPQQTPPQTYLEVYSEKHVYEVFQDKSSGTIPSAPIILPANGPISHHPPISSPSAAFVSPGNSNSTTTAGSSSNNDSFSFSPSNPESPISSAIHEDTHHSSASTSPSFSPQQSQPSASFHPSSQHDVTASNSATTAAYSFSVTQSPLENPSGTSTAAAETNFPLPDEPGHVLKNRRSCASLVSNSSNSISLNQKASTSSFSKSFSRPRSKPQSLDNEPIPSSTTNLHEPRGIAIDHPPNNASFVSQDIGYTTANESNLSFYTAPFPTSASNLPSSIATAQQPSHPAPPPPQPQHAPPSIPRQQYLPTAPSPLTYSSESRPKDAEQTQPSRQVSPPVVRRNTPVIAPQSSSSRTSTNVDILEARVTGSQRTNSMTFMRRRSFQPQSIVSASAEERTDYYREQFNAKRDFKRQRQEFEDDDRVLVGKKVSEGHQNYTTAYYMLTGIRVSVSRCNAKVDRPLTEKDFKARQKLAFDVAGNELIPSSKYEFKFKDYSPWVFRHLRALFQLDPADYLMSLTSKYILSELSSPGKSGSFFYFSRDFRFIIKTIHHSEHRMLRKILKDYYNHIKNNPNTLISQFYGLHRVKLPWGKKVHFIVMNNLFPPYYDMRRTYDLKGSTLGREHVFKPNEDPNNSTAVKKDLNWKANNEHLILGPQKTRVFLEQLERDVELLKRLNIMDYSLLIGIHDLNKTTPLRQSVYVVEPAHSENTNPRELRKAVTMASPTAMNALDIKDFRSGNRNLIFYADQGGFQSTDDNNQPLSEIYFLGVIDCLTPYTFVKRVETFVKGISHERITISAIPAVEYGARFYNFMKSTIQERKPDPSVPQVTLNNTTVQVDIQSVTPTTAAAAVSGSGPGPETLRHQSQADGQGPLPEAIHRETLTYRTAEAPELEPLMVGERY